MKILHFLISILLFIATFGEPVLAEPSYHEKLQLEYERLKKLEKQFERPNVDDEVQSSNKNSIIQENTKIQNIQSNNNLRQAEQNSSSKIAEENDVSKKLSSERSQTIEISHEKKTYDEIKVELDALNLKLKVIEDFEKSSEWKTISPRNPEFSSHMTKKFAVQKEIKNLGDLLKDRCTIAGYTNQQAKRADFECLGIDLLGEYMSSNTYADIKMGDSILKYPAFKKFQLKEWTGGAYRTEDCERENAGCTVILTRFGLVDIIYKQLPSSGVDANQQKKLIFDALEKKYKRADRCGKKARELFTGNFSCERLFFNGDDLILTNGSVVIYSSNVDLFIEASLKEKQEINNTNKKNKLLETVKQF